MAPHESWPTELRVTQGGRTLRVSFENGPARELSAEFLRVSSPSAEVQGHSPAERNVPGGKRAVAISGIEPIGNYAVKLRFDDGHDTGLFTWGYLNRLAADHDALWQAYLDELRAKGLSRG